METPQQTIELLAKLEKLGLDDVAFWRIHHWREKGECESIEHHADYCETVGSFEAGGTNALVQRRLKLILGAYKAGSFSSGRSEVFSWLAEAAYAEIPPAQERS